jgi:hypothetical protein
LAAVRKQIQPHNRMNLVTEDKKCKAERKWLREITEHKQRQIEERQAERQDREQKDKNFTKETEFKSRVKKYKK